VVIIPEGIEAVYSAQSAAHSPEGRSLALHRRATGIHWERATLHDIQSLPSPEKRNEKEAAGLEAFKGLPGPVLPDELSGDTVVSTISTNSSKETDHPGQEEDEPRPDHKEGEEDHHHEDPPTFYIGFSLISGFILMFLIDKLPRHASENLQPAPPPRHISLHNLSEGLHSSSTLADEESESFLQSLTPTPKQSRSLATTTGLVIHAAADGIAMGASASTANTKLGFIIFVAIMVHKAPAAFGLTSVLLKQGLSKRAARGHLIIFSLAAPFGALTTWLLVHVLGGGHIEGEKGQWWTGMLLLFSAGTFLYVAMHAMQEESGHDHTTSNGYAEGSGSQRKASKPQMRDTFAAVGGMLIPLLTQFGHHH